MVQYIPVSVDHNDANADDGVFLLMQGVQRRIIFTISHETGENLNWARVLNMTMGNMLSGEEVYSHVHR